MRAKYSEITVRNWIFIVFMIAGACTIKLFIAVIYVFSYEAGVFVSGKPFQPNLTFVGEARSLP
jgi:hypothetical protein